MAIGRQVDTGFGSRIDLLAIDSAANLVLLELKRNQTPREVIAQVLEYGAWVVKQKADDIAQIYSRYLERHHPERGRLSFDQAFRDRFELRDIPEDLNQAHELVVVASNFDATSERIVAYLAEEHDVAINAIFFRVFKDSGRKYLARVWLRDPSDLEIATETKKPGSWNGEYYVSFGGDRDWDEARKYGFISGGGGRYYSQTLYMLSPGDRVWVNVPATGYVGVGRVEQPVVPIEEFLVDKDGKQFPITALQKSKNRASQKEYGRPREGGVHRTRQVGQDCSDSTSSEGTRFLWRSTYGGTP